MGRAPSGKVPQGWVCVWRGLARFAPARSERNVPSECRKRGDIPTTMRGGLDRSPHQPRSVGAFVRTK